MLGNEARERYEDALETLSDTDCQLIVMHTELGMSTTEIAGELGKTPDAARVALGARAQTAGRRDGVTDPRATAILPQL